MQISTEQISGEPGLHRETLSKNKTKVTLCAQVINFAVRPLRILRKKKKPIALYSGAAQLI